MTGTDLTSGVAASAIALVFRVQMLNKSGNADVTWHEAQLALCVYVLTAALYAGGECIIQFDSQQLN